MAKKTLSNRSADKLMKQVLTCAPLFDETKLGEIEKAMQQPIVGQARRMALILATKGGDHYKEATVDREHAVILAGMLNIIKGQRERLEKLQEIYACVEARGAVALCHHGDMDAICAEGVALMTE